ncbi:MAG: thioredoxin fold domain-containing protein [Muribaculaceae bacterium]|nr:thioredoxin fold domain-containing protein [Muribaculaceae bacterium]
MAFKFTDENVKETIATGQPVVIDFWATWCGPCMAMGPVVDQMAEEFEGRAVIGKYNIEEESSFCEENRVMSIPLLLFFKDGKKTPIRLTGKQSAETLRAKIEELLAL